MSYDTIDSVGKKLAAANTSLKKSAKKEARKAKKKGQHVLPEPYSTDDVLWRDVISVLGQDIVDNIIEEGTEWDSPFEFREEVDVEVHSLSSNGVCRLAWYPVCDKILVIYRRSPSHCSSPSTELGYRSPILPARRKSPRTRLP